jgi:hypothetical protein
LIERDALKTLEGVWAYREEILYPSMFGNLSRGIFPLELEMFENMFNQREVDPRWLFLGVFEFEPTSTRKSWLYVTSGASTPWDTEPKDYRVDESSWLGVEFVIEVPEKVDWPIHVLRRLLGFHLLASHGRFGNSAPFDYGHRIPANGTVDGSADSELTFFAIAKANHYSSSAQLDSGYFDFLHVVGITERERDYAKATSTDDLIEKLRMSGAFPVTKPERGCVPL